MEFNHFTTTRPSTYNEKMLRLLNIGCIIGLVTILYYNWQDLTACFHRQALAIVITFVYWQFRGHGYSSYYSEIFQIFVIFMLIQKINIKEVQEDKECLYADTMLKKSIYILYVIFFSYYMSVFTVFFIIVVLFAMSEIRNSPWATSYRNASIRGREFESLEKIRFSAGPTEAHSQTMCSICLVDFEEQEEIIQLPICNHHFHKPCLKQSLEMHSQCPYCRSNIINNLKLWKEQSRSSDRQAENNEEPGDTNIQMSESLSNTLNSRLLQQNETSDRNTVPEVV